MIKKILFIQSFILEQEQLTDEILVWPIYLENFLKSKLPNLEFDLLYLPAEQKRRNLTIESLEEIDMFNSQMDYLTSNLKFELDESTLICLSGTTSHHFLSVKLIAEYFQKNYQKNIIVFGGAHASALPYDFNYSNSPIDYIVMGEGEITLYELLKKEPKKQKIPETFPYSCITDLDLLPTIDFNIFDKYISEFKNLSINLSRGCPFVCDFCMEKTYFNSIQNTKIKPWRVYSPKRAVQEVRTMIDYGSENQIESFGFYDPTFGLKKKWLETFLDYYDLQDKASPWIETRLDMLNEKLLRKFHQNNFRLWYGLESYSKKVLAIMKKTTDPNAYLNKFEGLYEIHKELDLPFMVNILFNHPGETKETYFETYERLYRMIVEDNIDSMLLNIRFYHHFPGTSLYNNFRYYNETYGAIAYFPNWWKKEELLKHGLYCVRSSHSLGLRESFELYTDLYKKLISAYIDNLKALKPPNAIQKALLLKNRMNVLDMKKSAFFDFLNERNIEMDQENVIATIKV